MYSWLENMNRYVLETRVLTLGEEIHKYVMEEDKEEP